MILGVPVDSALDAVYEGSRVAQVLTQKSLELGPGQRHQSLATLILVLLEADPSIYERGCERGTVIALSSSGVEAILRNGNTPCVIYHSIYPGNELSDDVHGGLLS